MYAVIETGGKQYQVKEGDIVFIEKLEAEGEITFDKVIMVGKDDGVKVGAPYVDGASVKATLLKNGKAKKITVFTYKISLGLQRKLFRNNTIVFHFRMFHRLFNYFFIDGCGFSESGIAENKLQ